jgi:hypothetical protein
MQVNLSDEDLRILIAACEAFDDRFSGSDDANAAVFLASKLETVIELGYDPELTE